MIRLRLAGADDLALLVAQREDFFRDAHPAVPRPSAAELAGFIRDTLTTRRGVVVLAEDLQNNNSLDLQNNNSLDPANCYAGSLALCAVQGWAWSPQLVMVDRWFHVRREHRGGPALLQLIRAGRAIARRRGLALWLADNVSGKGRARLFQIGRATAGA